MAGNFSEFNAVFRSIPKTRREACRLIFGAAAGSASFAAQFNTAQAAYPDRPIKIIVPFTPGGASDFIAQIVGVPLSRALGQPVVIEHRGGANGSIGITAVARSEPDGLTLLVVSNVFDINPALYKQAAYDPIKDFAPIADIASAPNVLATSPKSGIKSFADLAEKARARPDEFDFSTPGTGSLSHLGAELMKIRAGISLMHVPFAGSGPAIQAALAGTVHLVGVTVASALPHIQAGTLVALVQSGSQRWPDLPDVPTLADVGLPSATAETYFSLYAPATTPKDILGRLATAALEIIRRPEVQEQIRKTNFRPVGNGPDIVAARLARDVPTWREVVIKSKLRLE